jgi:hypothetical protein
MCTTLVIRPGEKILVCKHREHWGRRPEEVQPVIQQLRSA